jgi:inorganic pyrophosphatase
MAHYLQETHRLEIQAYQKPKNIGELQKTHVAFSGSLRKHPYDSGKIILVTDPFSANTFYYEFSTGDITYAEELPNLVNPEGETIRMARLWVKKKCIGVRCTPFIVEDTRT